MTCLNSEAQFQVSLCLWAVSPWVSHLTNLGPSFFLWDPQSLISTSKDGVERSTGIDWQPLCSANGVIFLQAEHKLFITVKFCLTQIITIKITQVIQTLTADKPMVMRKADYKLVMVWGSDFVHRLVLKQKTEVVIYSVSNTVLQLTKHPRAKELFTNSPEPHSHATCQHWAAQWSSASGWPWQFFQESFFHHREHIA